LRQKNFQKALFFLNKALSIDNENKNYWKRYAALNRELHFYEEAELGYRKAVEFGDSELDTWLFWVDALLSIGEIESAITTLLQATEFYPESFEIEYRLAGLYYMTRQDKKGKFHISNAFRLNGKHYSIIETLFPIAWKRKMVQNIIKKHLESGKF
jgi:tetratricopeptide (TPR) repeat protein